ncbi:hypothetical protein GCM10023188_38460 [Pontibacter saemangeumensis]|uniref:Oxidase n=2 Tax=Pontibacter saemangeumensis TaxID=1084525 RepID=A0ABP8LZR8_9BACT
MIAVYAQPYVEIGDLTRDAISVAEGRFYYGLVSNLGILLWCATAAICLFTAVLLKDWKLTYHRNFLLSGGLLTIVLLMDDFFLLHEAAIPMLLGIGEKYVISMYPLLMVLFLACFINKILNTGYLVLLSALCFLGLSVLTDAFETKVASETFYLLEEGFKFMGIVGWFYYFTSTCLLVQNIAMKKKLYQ